MFQAPTSCPPFLAYVGTCLGCLNPLVPPNPMSLLLFFTGKAVSARRVPTVGLRSLLKSCVCPFQTHCLAQSSPFCFLSCADLQGPITMGFIAFWFPVGVQPMGGQREIGGREESTAGCLFTSDVHPCWLSKGLRQPPGSLVLPLSLFRSRVLT